MEEVLSIIIPLVSVVAGILQIVLFFKVWGMCNDIKAMRQVQAPKEKEGAEEKTLSKGNTREAVGCAFLAVVFLVIIIIAFLLD